MRMTLVYARISDRTVADEYFRVTEAVEASYRTSEPLPAAVEGANMRRLAADHRRLLGNGHCTRPAALDCNFETICERCGFFDTGPQFIPILTTPTRPRPRTRPTRPRPPLQRPPRRHRQPATRHAPMTPARDFRVEWQNRT